MEIFLYVILGIVALFFIAGFRGLIAQNRLQKCIDNGTIDLVGHNKIELGKSLSDEQKDKIRLEWKMFTSCQRAYPGVLRLYESNELR